MRCVPWYDERSGVADREEKDGWHSEQREKEVYFVAVAGRERRYSKHCLKEIVSFSVKR